MRKRIAVLIGILGISTCLWATPTQINYQGTLKEKGVPASGSKSMKFEVISNGQSVWTQVSNVMVTNGLFSVNLNPTGVDWQNLANPQLQVTIGNQVLTPAEPITAAPYAVVATSVTYGAVPQGAILMFTGNCPAGYTRFAALDNRFPMGVDPFVTVPGTHGGNTTHTHGINSDGAHNHSGSTSGAIRDSSHLVSTPAGAPSGEYVEDVANQPRERVSGHTHGITLDGNHNHGGTTTAASSLPPYEALVFCQKQ